MREPPGPCGAGRLRCVWLCGGLAAVCAGGRRPAAWPVLLGLAAVCAGGRRPAREIATREPGGSEWSISKPGQAPPPPTGTAAWPCKPPRVPRRPPIGRCSLSVRCRPGPATAHRHRGQVLPPPINFACNSPPLSCRFVSVCSVVSLVFLNCMRLLLNAAPDSARRYRGGAFWTLSALPIDQTGCVCG